MKIIVGAGKTKYDGWIPTQEDELNLLNMEQWENLKGDKEIEAILAEHVWEHLSLEEGKEAAKNCFRFLKEGGYVRCAVPDKNFKNALYQSTIKIGGPGEENHPATNHKIVYDYKTLVKVFEEAGFEVSLLEYCDEHGDFHYKPWDESKGKIYRSYRFDNRNSSNKLGMVSIIIDAVKPIKNK
ncbi:MAG: class I SAM-dependent methyltransferase [Clostridium sp.]|uniref:class I SAM-dependent methyltransferase n=1 Tax=Clostridium sp. TaxID=1506 RepID=UPI00399B836F